MSEDNDLLIPKKVAEIMSKPVLQDSDNEAHVSRIVNNMILLTINSDGDLVPVDAFDSSGNLKTADQTKALSDVIKEDDVPAAATDATVALEAGFEFELIGIFAAMIADGNAANRVFNIQIDQLPTLLAGQVSPSHQTTGITLTLGQSGSISMGSGPDLQTNDNGVSAIVPDENPLPMPLSGLSTISAVATNKQAADEIGLRTWVRKVA